MGKWKCGKCSKLLSSKQSAINHINVIHEDEANTIKFVRVNSDECPASNRAGNSSSAKNQNAYKFFAPVADVFSNGNTKELYWGARGNAQKSSISDVHSPLKDPNLSTGLESSSQVIGTVAMPSSTQRFPVTSSFNPPFKVPLQLSSCDVSDMSLAATSTIDNNIISSPSSYVDDGSNLSTSPTASFISHNKKLKTRGHCGSEECVGCNRQPCGECYNCLHKRETR